MSIGSFRSFVKNVGVLFAAGGVFNSGVINFGGDKVLFTGEELFVKIEFSNSFEIIRFFIAFTPY